jgi:hypothetical protein
MDYIFTCIHCQEIFVVAYKEFNCRILRHGVYKHNLQPINPHASKDECDALVRDGRIYGCGGPLQIVETKECASRDADADADAGVYEVIICDYV